MTDQEKLDCMNKMKEMEDKIRAQSLLLIQCQFTFEAMLSDSKISLQYLKPLHARCVELTKEDL